MSIIENYNRKYETDIKLKNQIRKDLFHYLN